MGVEITASEAKQLARLLFFFFFSFFLSPNISYRLQIPPALSSSSSVDESRKKEARPHSGRAVLGPTQESGMGGGNPLRSGVIHCRSVHAGRLARRTKAGYKREGTSCWIRLALRVRALGKRGPEGKEGGKADQTKGLVTLNLSRRRASWDMEQ